MIKKMMLLAVAAAAVVAFAVPAAASAAEWEHSGVPIAQDETVEFTGPACFSTATAGACATVHIHAILEAGSTGTGTVTSFSSTECVGTGQLAGLTCTETPAGGWHIQANADGTITINDIEIHNQYYHPADVGHTTPLATSVLTGDVRATPDNPSEISTVTLEGINTVANGNPASVEGELEASPAGTFGIG